MPGNLQTEARQTDTPLKGNPQNLQPMNELVAEGGETCASCKQPMVAGQAMLGQSQDPYFPQFCGPECAMKGGQSEAQKFFEQMEQKPQQNPTGPVGATALSPIQGNIPTPLRNNENKLSDVQCGKCGRGMTLCKCHKR